MNFDAATKYNKQCGLPVFVLNLPTPQANPLGFLLPKYDKSNIVQLFEAMNRYLSELIEEQVGVYLIDFDAICATIGKRYINDDLTSHINHGSFIGNTYWAEDIDLTPYGSAEAIYQPKLRQAVLAVFNECLAAHYIISSNIKIKIVIFDLDGTLWRGVPAEADELAWERISEGWPLSILEAAAFLKKRGVLLAIASKNEPSVAKDIWEKTYGKRFPLSNFASIRISWDSKVKSVGEILSEVNLLPENCLFVDDNPVEREQIRAAFPEISVITGPDLDLAAYVVVGGGAADAGHYGGIDTQNGIDPGHDRPRNYASRNGFRGLRSQFGNYGEDLHHRQCRGQEIPQDL